MTEVFLLVPTGCRGGGICDFVMKGPSNTCKIEEPAWLVPMGCVPSPGGEKAERRV